MCALLSGLYIRADHERGSSKAYFLAKQEKYSKILSADFFTQSAIALLNRFIKIEYHIIPQISLYLVQEEIFTYCDSLSIYRPLFITSQRPVT